MAKIRNDYTKVVEEVRGEIRQLRHTSQKSQIPPFMRERPLAERQKSPLAKWVKDHGIRPGDFHV